MPNHFTYQAAIQRLACLADRSNPPRVALAAASKLAKELSPANPRHELISRMLKEANPYEVARHKLRELYDRPETLSPEPKAPESASSALEIGESTSEEEDDYW